MPRVRGALRPVQQAPLEFTYKSDIVALLAECLIKAVEAQTMDVGLPKPLKDMIPLVEFSFETTENHGGGITTGRFVGATDKRGEDAIERVCRAGDFLATIYHHLGIDYAKTFIKDFNGRPTPIVDHGKAIRELIG